MTFDAFKDILLASFPDVTPLQLDRFARMEPLYREWNAKINVISRKDMDSLYDHHIIHSLAIAKYISLLGEGFLPEEEHTVLDLGTGGGFPGIPLKIVRPDIALTLVDSLGKRVRFLEEVCAALGISAKAVHARAEDAARNDALRAHFDIALSRAVAPMKLLLELTVPFLKVGGR